MTSTPAIPGALPTSSHDAEPNSPPTTYGEPTSCSELESRLFLNQIYPMTEYPELQELPEELIQDEEVKAKRLGTPPQFEAITQDGDFRTDPTAYQHAPFDTVVKELIAQGIHEMVQRQQIDTLWRLYDQSQKENKRLQMENKNLHDELNLQEQLQHQSRAPSPNPMVQTSEGTTASLSNFLLPRSKPRRAEQGHVSPLPPPPRENREDSAATNVSQSGQRSAKVRDAPQLTDGINPSFRKWKMQIEHKFVDNHDHFPSDHSKVAYIVDRVDGEAYDIIESYLEAGHRSTSSELIELLSKRFNDPHRRFKAKDQLTKLVMKPFGDFSTHVSEFIRLANLSQLTREQWKEDLHNTLYSKLKSSMILYRSNSHIDFEEYCNIAQEMAYGLKQEYEENRERRETKQRQQTQMRSNPASKPPQASASPSSMPQSAKPQDTQGNQKPQSEITCYTCGKKGHIRPNCPERKPNTSVKAVEPAELPAHSDPKSDSEN
jgi:hypothetical protein